MGNFIRPLNLLLSDYATREFACKYITKFTCRMWAVAVHVAFLRIITLFNLCIWFSHVVSCICGIWICWTSRESGRWHFSYDFIITFPPTLPPSPPANPFSTFYHYIYVFSEQAVELTDEDDWRNGLKVRLLLKSTVRTFSLIWISISMFYMICYSNFVWQQWCTSFYFTVFLSMLMYNINASIQVKPSQGQANKVGNEGHPIGRKDETTHLEIQCSKQNHSEDSLPQSDSQFHAPQVRPSGILSFIRGLSKFIACSNLVSLAWNRPW